MEQLLYTIETEHERLQLACRMREQLAQQRPNMSDWAPKPVTWEEWQAANTNQPRIYYQLALYDILTTCRNCLPIFTLDTGEQIDPNLDMQIGPLYKVETSDGKCAAWVGRCKNPHGFKHWVRSPSSNPGRGTRHRTLEEAVRWANSWIEMREELLRRERRTECYKLILRTVKLLGGVKPDTYDSSA